LLGSENIVGTMTDTLGRLFEQERDICLCHFEKKVLKKKVLQIFARKDIFLTEILKGINTCKSIF
jgi:hypothetical protein